ncbi:MAG: hypothetical protein K2H44_03970 [Muribaculaceae bacterium]|nr:hypothetical protein [Muribaculaceae bacterium]MDE5844529.1 hypothetical protein [Muribaculaceae bacterium]
MKAITIRKNWNEEIEKLDETLQPVAVWALYQFVKNGKVVSENSDIQRIISLADSDLKRIAIAREKARERREKLKREKLIKQQLADVKSVENECGVFEKTETENEKKQREEYEQYPELFMFDGFMSFICSKGGEKYRPDVSDEFNFFELICHFREWVLDHNKIKEITHLNAFRGLFKLALPRLKAIAIKARKKSAVA